MRKLVILVSVILLITGCGVNYHVEIKEDLKILETAILEGNNDLYNSHYLTTKVKVLQEILDIYNDELHENNYQTEVVKKEMPYVKIEREYQDIQNYLDNSKLFNNYFDKINYTKEGKIVKIETEGFNPNEYENPDRFYVENLDIAIKCAYKVVDSNATEIDKKTNTYHFIMNANDEDFKIMLKIDTSSKFIANLDLYLVLLGIIVLTIVSWILVIVNKKKNNS